MLEALAAVEFLAVHGAYHFRVESCKSDRLVIPTYLMQTHATTDLIMYPLTVACFFPEQKVKHTGLRRSYTAGQAC